MTDAQIKSMVWEILQSADYSAYENLQEQCSQDPEGAEDRIKELTDIVRKYLPRSADSAKTSSSSSASSGSGKKMYVGNLSYDTGEAELQEMFEAYGTVQSAWVVTDRETGRSKGFGFVEMSTAAEMNSAIAALNGKRVGGRSLTVSEARPKTDKPAGGYSGGGGKSYGGGSGSYEGGGGYEKRERRGRSY